MKRILYAADNRSSSAYNLIRFFNKYKQKYNIKTAAYSKSYGKSFGDFNLDCLLNFSNYSKTFSTYNNNYKLYASEIKDFKPDLIISDLEPYTSYIGIDLGIPVWQVSPLLIYYGDVSKNKMSIYKKYSHLFPTHTRDVAFKNFILNNSYKKIINSYLCDISNSPQLKEGYTYCRPDYIEGNCNNLIDGSVALISDCFYNGEICKLETNYADSECVVGEAYYKYYEKEIALNENIHFLSHCLENYFKGM